MAPAGTPHPLDPLSPEEVGRAAAVCRAHAASLGLRPLRFNTITLQEPPKRQLLAFSAGRLAVLPRVAFCILQTPPEFAVIEGLVELRSGNADSIVGWAKLDASQLDGQPLATPDDCLEAEAIARQDGRVQQLAEQRGVPFDKVACDPWAIHACPEEWQGRRLMQVFMYAKACPDDNEYAHPLDLCVVVDLNEGSVIHIDAYEQPPAIPKRDANYHRALLRKPFRQPPKPLTITQPEGPSFTVDGWAVSWQQWDFRLSFNSREGLVLHQLSYEDPDQGRRRPVMHRGSISEMAVPYADPRPPYNRKCAFDAGDYGLGFGANSLALGCDCLGEVHYFDGVVNDAAGQPVVIKNAVCLHEEDAGLLWKHLDYRTGYAEVRRSRRLVVSFIMTAVNYDYLFYWYLYQDGTIGHEVKLTGILSTSLLSPGEPNRPTHGILVAPGVNAAAHQHLFCARLDMAVDDDDGGRGLVVSEVDARQEAMSAANPAGNAFVCVETDLTTVHAAQRLAAPELNRVWRFKNPARLHPSSRQPVAYQLHPAQGPCLLAQPDSAVAQRGIFTTKNLWLVPHEDGQLFPAGLYVLQSRQDSGLRQWALQDRSLLGADPVCFYTFGVTHFVRPEDWPVMPVDVTGFTLRPVGFFESNPALDVPPEDATQQGAGSHEGDACCSSSTQKQQQQRLAGTVGSNFGVSKL